MMKMSSVLALCGAITGYSQSTGILSGRVLAEGRQQSLSAAITLVSAGAGVRFKTIAVDDGGTFALDAPLGAVLVIARADGHVSEQREVTVRPGRANPALNFSLPRAGSVSGRVVDLTGAAVGGSRVWLHYPGEVGAWRPADEIGGEPADALGNFTIPTVAQDRPFVLHVENENWLPSSSRPMMIRAAELRGVLLMLSRRGASVAGRVLDSGGRPVAGAAVTLRTVPADNEFTSEQRNSLAFSRTLNRTAVSQEDGSYSFRGVPAGRIVVTAQQQNGRAAVEAQATTGQVSNVDLSLRNQ